MTSDSLQRWELVQKHALATGALLPLATRAESVRDQGMEFSIRVVESLTRKPVAGVSVADARLSTWPVSPERGRERGEADVRERNPFLPYERDLYVCDVPPHHVCLLNKYQVVAAHLLLITRDFHRQEAALNADDFTALSWALSKLDGLGFYNGGRMAGASQPHKHLQLIPFLDPRQTGFPLLAMWDQAAKDSDSGVWRAPLPFPHALERISLECGTPSPAATAGQELFAVYRKLLLALHRGDPATEDPLPYNLLLTRRWMFVVPRARECVEEISLNALAFAGGLLVRNDHELARIHRRGPLSMLIAATVDRRQWTVDRGQGTGDRGQGTGDGEE